MAVRALDPAAIVAALPRPEQGGNYLLGLSGGLDSTVLLHVIATIRPALPLRVLHIHHGLQPRADDWVKHCAAFCASVGVAFEAKYVKPDIGPGRSIEAEARVSRYVAFSAAMQPGDILLTAHHLDDQAETLLLQLLRGSGVRGLAAMPVVDDFGRGRHCRPLLNTPRKSLEDYARLHDLSWVEDPSNADSRYARNRLRTEIMPLLRQGWPEASEMLGRSARHSADAAQILDEAGKADLAGCNGLHAESLHIPALLALSAARRRNALRVWFEVRGLPLPTAAHVGRIETEVLGAAIDAMPLLTWPGVEVRRYRDQLFATAPLPGIPTTMEWEWRLPPAQAGDALVLAPGCGLLEATASANGGLRRPRPNEQVRVRLAQGGERIRLRDRSHHHELKHLQQQAGIPPWVRSRLPLIYFGDELAAVADLWICHGFAAEGSGAGLSLRWREAPAGYPSPEA